MSPFRGGVVVDVQGVPELIARFGRIGKEAERKIVRHMEVASRQIFRHATTFAPPPIRVKRFTDRTGKHAPTGALKAAIVHRPGPYRQRGVHSVEVGIPAGRLRHDYGRYVELGTGRRGASKLHGMAYIPPGYRHGGKPGMLPQPFLYGEFRRVSERFLRDCVTIVSDVIRESRR